MTMYAAHARAPSARAAAASMPSTAASGSAAGGDSAATGTTGTAVRRATEAAARPRRRRAACTAPAPLSQCCLKQVLGIRKNRRAILCPCMMNKAVCRLDLSSKYCCSRGTNQQRATGSDVLQLVAYAGHVRGRARDQLRGHVRRRHLPRLHVLVCVCCAELSTQQGYIACVAFMRLLHSMRHDSRWHRQAPAAAAGAGEPATQQPALPPLARRAAVCWARRLAKQPAARQTY